MIPAFERPMWQAPYFSHHIRYGDTPSNKHVGNAIAVIGDERDENVRDSELERINKLGLPMIVDIGTHPPNNVYLNLTVAWLANYVTVQTALQYPEKPVIAYLDGDDWPDSNPFNPDRVWPSIQAYRLPDETLNQFKLRVDGVIKRVASYKTPMCLVSRFDDFNGSSSVERTLECMPIYEQWLRDYYFVAHMPFADRRGNGISSNPELWNQARAFQYAIPFERPNRFDYWVPSGSDILTILKNKLGQSRASVVLESYLRADILSKYSNTPTPSPGVWPNLLSTLQQVRAEHPTKIGVDECVIILNKVAWMHRATGWGLLHKPGGNHGAQPTTNIPVSVDWLVNNKLNKGADCIINAPSNVDGALTSANPTWPSDGEDIIDISIWVAPVKP